MKPFSVDQLQAAIYVLDANQRYAYVNDAYAGLLGLSGTQIIGRTVWELREQGSYDICISDYVFQEKRQVSVFSNISVDDGISLKKKKYLVRATPLFDRDNNVTGMYAVCEDVDEIREALSEADSRSLFSQTLDIANPVIRKDGDLQIIAESPAMKQTLRDAERIAKTESTVLLTGETGVGKELIAKLIHKSGPRANRRMITINCAALPENLLESTLFGYEKGAFTGALSTGKKGMIEEANHSTLFLDEINSMPLRIQGELLRTLENKTIQPVGSSEEIPVDFRLISASNADLESLVEEGLFRKDLFYRLNVLPLTLAPLRDRREDIIPLLLHFTRINCERYHKHLSYSDESLHWLKSEPWKGNIRELRNVAERVVVICDHETVTIKDLQIIMDTMGERGDLERPAVSAPEASDPGLENGMPLKDYLEACEKRYLSYALEQFGSTYKAAAFLHTSQSSVARAKKKYHL